MALFAVDLPAARAIVEPGYPARVPRQTPREAGRKAGEAALDKAETHRAFDAAGAKRFIVSQLVRHGQMSGEDLTDAAKAHGFRPIEDRAFGPIYAALVREGTIRCAGYVARRKGRGTAGGRLWVLVR